MSIEYEKGFRDGYERALDDNRIVHGKAAERLMDQVMNPKPMSKGQKRLLKECTDLYDSTQRQDTKGSPGVKKFCKLIDTHLSQVPTKKEEKK